MRLLNICLICILLSNCTTKDGQHINPPVVSIDPNSTAKDLDISQLVKNAQVVRLDSRPECSIGLFSWLVYADSELIIYKSDKKLLIFDGRGKFQYEIDHLGKGPGEYETISNVQYDPSKRLVYIIDYHTIKSYNLDGAFVEKYNPSFKVGGMLPYEDEGFLVPHQQVYSQENRGMLSICDSAFIPLTTFKSRNNQEIRNTNQNLFYTTNPYLAEGKYFYKEPFVDTLYRIENQELIPHRIYHFNARKFNTVDGINSEAYSKAISSGKVPPIGILESDTHLFIKYQYEKSIFYSMYSGNDKTDLIFHKSENGEESYPQFSGLKNDFHLEIIEHIWPDYINVQKNQFVSIINPDGLTDEINSALGLHIGDNPLLIFWDLK
ncbi:MAG: 6-bladed beta-propeller [Bacteroidota bacterium]